MGKRPVGEKYISVKIVGHDFVNAYLNTKKVKPNEPDFKGDGVAIWVHTIQERKDDKGKTQSPI